jgi:methionine sulfoxide reductase heme-binding subunit
MTAWMLARASGLTAYVFLAIATIAGLLLSSRYMGKKASRTLTLLHEATSIAGVILIFVHAWAILNDSFFKFTLGSLLVPGLSPYAPLWVGVGVVAGYLSVLVVASFYLRKKIGARTWRRIHYSTPFAFAAMTAHGIASGTDSANVLAVGLYSGVTVVVGFLLGYRIVASFADRKVKAERKAAALARVAQRREPVVGR